MLAVLSTLGIHKLLLSSSSSLPNLALHSRYLGIHRRLARQLLDMEGSMEKAVARARKGEHFGKNRISIEGPTHQHTQGVCVWRWVGLGMTGF